MAKQLLIPLKNINSKRWLGKLLVSKFNNKFSLRSHNWAIFLRVRTHTIRPKM